MNKVQRKITRTVQLAKNVRLHRADGGETDPMLDQAIANQTNALGEVKGYEGQVLSAPEPMTVGQLIAQNMRRSHEQNIRNFPQDVQNLAVVQGIKQLPHQIMESVKYPGMALKGELVEGIDPHTGQVVGVTPSGMGPTEAGMIISGLMSTGALPEIAAGRVTPNVSRVFAGPGSKTADLTALEKAQTMADKGFGREDIMYHTGWFQGADKKWRYEIPDIEAKFNSEKLFGNVPNRFALAEQYFEQNGVPAKKFATGQFPDLDKKSLEYADKIIAEREGGVPLGKVLEHPEFFAAYPDAANILVNETSGRGYHGTYNPDFNEITISKPYLSSDIDKPRSTALHEIQHYIQTEEGLAPGANTLFLRPNTPAWEIYQERIKAMKTPMTLEEFEKQGIGSKDFTYKDYLKQTKKSLKENYPMLDRAAQEFAVQDAYKRAAGEVEARNVQARRNLTPEQLEQTYPWETQDTPYHKQIVSPARKNVGGRVGFADGGAPWGFDFTQPTIDFQPAQPPMPPLANLDLYKGAPLNKLPEAPKPPAAPNANDDAGSSDQFSGSGGGGESGQQSIASGPDFAMEMGPQMSEAPSSGLMSGLANAAGYGPGMTVGNTVGGLVGGVLGGMVAGPVGGILGGIAGRHAANAMATDKDEDESDDDDDDDDGGGDDGVGGGGGGNASEAASSAEQSGKSDASAEAATGNMQDGGAITMRRYRAHGGPIKITPAQASAGNYKKKHVNFQGLPLAIETPKGHIREKVTNGKVDWRVKMPVDYGYVKGTKDNDGDATDVFLGPHKNSDKVWVIDQAHHETGKFDEHKAMLGFKHKTEALKAYKDSFSDGKGHKRIMDATEMSVGQYKDWVKHGNLKKPVSSSPFIQKALMVASKKS